jgi:hypothetical protein
MPERSHRRPSGPRTGSDDDLVLQTPYDAVIFALDCVLRDTGDGMRAYPGAMALCSD